MAGRMPPLRRLVAALAAGAAIAVLIALLNGPWLRVDELSWDGLHYTDRDDLARVLGEERGRSILAVDSAAVASALERLPAVDDATVHASLPGHLRADVVERTPVFVWRTSQARLIGAADGTLFAAFGPDASLPPPLATLPFIDDRRELSRLITVGDVIPAGYVDVANRLTAIDGAAIGSSATGMNVRIDDTYGFQLVSGEVGWRVAFGFYAADPDVPASDVGARIDDQVAAVRTVFAAESETGISWVDARNPGKVYFRAKG